MLVPGNNLTDYHKKVGDLMTIELIKLGLISQEDVNNQDPSWPAYKKYFMHGTSHFLGLDVHDVGNYKIDGEDRPLKPGMVITVEPGIYISDDSDVPDMYKGIGVRIEDDVVITATGVDILTADVPKEIDEIEWADPQDPGIEGLLRELNDYKKREEDGEIYEPRF